MNVYYLYQVDAGLDEVEGCGIVAESEERARQIANENVLEYQEGKIWEDKEKVKCKLIDLTVEHEFMVDFRMG